MIDENYQDRNLKPDFSSAIVRPPRRRRRRFSDRDAETGGMNWLMTFTDIMGLMLTFFVMMYAMSEPEHTKFAEIASSLNTELTPVTKNVGGNAPQDNPDIQRINFARALDLDYLNALITQIVERDDVLKSTVRIVSAHDHLVLSLPDTLVFGQGQSAVRDGSAKVLFTLGGAFSRIKNRIELVGQTTATPERDVAVGSNWELALSRAAAVAGALEKVGYTEPVILRGDAYPHSVDGMNKENQKGDLSRRVDIVIMNHDGKERAVFRN